MFSSREMRYCASFMIIAIVLFDTVSLDAKRLLSSSRWGSSRSSSASRIGSSRSSGTRTGGNRSGSSGTGRVSRPVIPPWHPPPRPHVPAQVPKTPHNTGKDSSNILIHSEGGGRPRPGSTVNDHKQQSTPHKPTAPIETMSKSNAGSVNSQAPPGSSSGGAYPPWANPGAAPHGGTNSHLPPPNPSQTFGSPYPNRPYPPTHPPGPISHPPPVPGVGAPRGGNSYPNSPHGVSAPYPPSVPYPGGHPPGMPMPSAPHIGFGNVGHAGGAHQPIGNPHSYPSLGSPPMQPHVGVPHSTVIHNHYNAPPVGTPQNPAGHPNYVHQPIYGGAPVAQPFVPGQTTIFLPSQQSSSPGIGQLVKEALVFSTVNAGVNRLINGAPHHHDHYQPAAPAAPAQPASSTVTNTVIYNNQYGPPNPDGSGAAPVPGAAPIPGAAPVPGAAPFPGAAPVPMVPAGPPPSFPVAPPNTPTGNTGPNPNSGTPNSNVPQYPSPPPAEPSGTSHVPVPHRNGGQGGNVQPATDSTTNNANNQTAPPVYQYYISNEELWNLTETLFAKDEFNASQYVTLNLQNRLVDPNVTDIAPAQLLYVQWEAYAIPTIQILRDIYENYEFDSNKKESVNDQTRRKENVLLDVFLETNIMNTAMTWLSQKGYIESDSFEWKDTLRHIWMSKVNGATSGFERIFLAEKYDGPSILGGQNWVYFDHQESMKRINYMGYEEKIDLGRKSHLVKIHFKIGDAVKPNSTMLIGTPPELEMALYTICYYARPNDVCNVSLGGVKFNVYTHPFRYFGKDLIDLGLLFF